MSLTFNKKLIIIGFGSIGQAVLPLILKHIQLSLENIIIITGDDKGGDIASKYGIKNYIIKQLTPENYQEFLSDLVEEGDFVLNLSVNVDSVELIKLCRNANALYLDTCTEPWEGEYTDVKIPIEDRTNYALRKKVLLLSNESKVGDPTAIITHGANPGLVSHFVKEALLTIAKDGGIEHDIPKNKNDWANLANQLQIKVIHIAERDTQTTNTDKSTSEFCNTWSVDGLHSEACQPAELGWGTHEEKLPEGAKRAEKNACGVYLKTPGYATYVKTYTPTGETIGNLVTHAEALSISDYLTQKDNDGVVIYRPTVHYAYTPCDLARTSLEELKLNKGALHEHKRILMDEIKGGYDELGVLLMGHHGSSYWYGSKVTIEEARALLSHNNATSIQVAAGILAGLIWAIDNPNKGILEPDELPHNEILNIAKPYLGNLFGEYSNWTPVVAEGKTTNWNLQDFLV